MRYITRIISNRRSALDFTRQLVFRRDLYAGTHLLTIIIGCLYQPFGLCSISTANQISSDLRSGQCQSAAVPLKLFIPDDVPFGRRQTLSAHVVCGTERWDILGSQVYTFLYLKHRTTHIIHQHNDLDM
ncbi:hypothetical protein K470DRAFT_12712 [Piedraia hortae CBS 480.64]|uniref:Uncharacterized protein n=1 Tax=Piedraia hortae CBS 480.64 TaxID=1314780 RepID=A0A6A7BPA4_9PEZI|nr:hypothetical protein K470DRAFT_12712 [Piedraia hortae CBS 480.64]